MIKLYHVQHSKYPLYVIAKDYAHAVQRWQAVMAAEHPGLEEPDGVTLICRPDELLMP